MSSAKVRTGVDSWVNQGAASQNNGRGTLLSVRAGTNVERTFLYLKCPAPRDATVISATLRVYSSGASGSFTLSVQRVSASWKESQINYNNQPGVTGTVVSLTQTPSDGTEWALDVTDIVQLWASGTANYGLRLSTDDANPHKFHSLQSGDLRPVLEVTWSDAPDQPTELTPSGSLAVSVDFPTLMFTYHDVSGETAMGGCQVQINTVNNFTVPAQLADWGAISTSDPEFPTSTQGTSRTASVTATAGSTTVTAAAGTFLSSDFGVPIIQATLFGANGAFVTAVAADGSSATLDRAAVASGTNTATIRQDYSGIGDGETQWWRVRVQDAAGLWSPWSDPVSFTSKARGTLTIDNPAAAPDNFVNDVTPELSWTVAGAAQTGRQVIIADDSDPTTELLNTNRQHTAETTYTPPKGVITDESITYRLTVRTWDEQTRVKTPGDPIYIEQVRTFTFAEDPTPNPVTSLQAALAASGLPRVALTWDRATAPDSFSVWRNGIVVDTDLDPAGLFVAGTSYQYVDKTAQPTYTHTWKVRCKVNGKLSPSPEVTFTFDMPEVWLLDPDSETVMVPILARSDDKGAITYDMPEINGVYRPVDGSKVVRLVQGQYGLEGHIEGLIAARAAFDSDTWVGHMLTIKKNPGKTYRLVIGGQNLPVNVGNVVLSPPGGGGAPGDRRVAFDFWSLAGPVQK